MIFSVCISFVQDLLAFRVSVQAGIGLVNSFTLRTREVDEMAAVFQHLGPTGLLTGLVRQMRGSDGRAGSHGVAADVGIHKAHGHVFRQGVQRPLGRGIGCPTEGTSAVDRRHIDDVSSAGERVEPFFTAMEY